MEGGEEAKEDANKSQLDRNANVKISIRINIPQ